MIANEEQLAAARKAISNLEAALLSLREDILPKNRARFVLMAEPVVAQLRALRADVDDYIGMATAVSEEAEVWLRLRGPGLEFDDAPISIVSAVLRILKTGVQSAAEYLMGSPEVEADFSGIKEACDLRIVAWESGSVTLGLRLPDDGLTESGRVREESRRALDQYLCVADWVGSERDPSEIETQIANPTFRRLLLNQVSRLIPRPHGGLEAIELSSQRTKGSPIALTREGRKRVRKAIERSVDPESVNEVAAAAHGILREIDLDERTFTIRDPDAPTETKCTIGGGADDLLAIAKQALDHRVSVFGQRKRDPFGRRVYPLQVFEIEELGRTDEDVAEAEQSEDQRAK